MKSNRHWNRIAITVVLSLAASASQAHTGHGTSGFFEGLAHPIGLDHLLAMVAVGIWSVSALPAHKAWWGPATFMTSLVMSAVLGALGITVPFLENLISLSVVLFGVMLVLAKFKISPKIGLALIALAAAMHGLAHGAESPETGFAAYATGFLVTTATLHFGGVLAGLGIKRYVPSKESLVTSSLGLLFGGAGVYLFSQI
jgi:urease accessory protein